MGKPISTPNLVETDDRSVLAAISVVKLKKLTDIAKESGVTAPKTKSILEKLEEMELIYSVKKNNTLYYSLDEEE